MKTLSVKKEIELTRWNGLSFALILNQTEKSIH
jgi:hypothetical protein